MSKNSPRSELVQVQSYVKSSVPTPLEPWRDPGLCGD
jgi:hypothetical protein